MKQHAAHRTPPLGTRSVRDMGVSYLWRLWVQHIGDRAMNDGPNPSAMLLEPASVLPCIFGGYVSYEQLPALSL